MLEDKIREYVAKAAGRPWYIKYALLTAVVFLTALAMSYTVFSWVAGKKRKDSEDVLNDVKDRTSVLAELNRLRVAEDVKAEMDAIDVEVADIKEAESVAVKELEDTVESIDAAVNWGQVDSILKRMKRAE